MKNTTSILSAILVLAIAISMPGLEGNTLQIWVMNADGTDVENLTNDPSAAYSYPAWSPDGNRISFSSNRDNPNRDIFVMNSDGSNIINVLNDNTTIALYSSWSPDGERLIFDTAEIAGPPPHHFKLYMINADGSGRYY